MRNATNWQNLPQFKIMNPIYGDKNFAEDPPEIHPKTFIPEELVNTTFINSNNDNYSEIKGWKSKVSLRSETKGSRFEFGC